MGGRSIFELWKVLFDRGERKLVLGPQDLERVLRFGCLEEELKSGAVRTWIAKAADDDSVASNKRPDGRPAIGLARLGRPSCFSRS